MKHALRRAAMLLLCVSADSVARADTWEITLSPTNAISEFQVEAPPFAYTEIRWFRLVDYRVPTLNPAKFTITNMTFRISGILAVAMGDYGSFTADGVLEADVNVSQAEQEWFWDYRLASPEGDRPVVGFAQFSDYHLQPLDLSPFGPSINTNFLTGSARDEGGFLSVTLQTETAVSERLFDPSYENQYSASLFSAMTEFRLTVTYGFKTNGPAISPGDLPTGDPEPPFAIMTHQVVGTNYLRYPDTQSWPPAFRNLVGLRITDTRTSGGDVQLTWNTLPGKTNYVQAAASPAGPFVNISGPIVSPGEDEVVPATYTDPGAATNTAPRCYRVKIER